MSKGEAAKDSMIREAREEIGIDILPANLNVVQVMHRKTNRDNIDIFISCSSMLPSDIVEYVKNALVPIKNKTFYSELGWKPAEVST